MDIVTHSFNGFPTANADEFAELLRAIGASGPEAPKPTALDTFLGTHPVAKTFLTTQKPAPVSYATVPYFGVNAFSFTNAAGHRSNVRYRFVPLVGELVSRLLGRGRAPEEVACGEPLNVYLPPTAGPVAGLRLTGTARCGWFAAEDGAIRR